MNVTWNLIDKRFFHSFLKLTRINHHLHSNQAKARHVTAQQCHPVNSTYFTRQIRCYNSSNTIAALASGQGKCGIAVIRVSGPDSAAVLKDFTRTETPPAARKFIYRDIVDPASGELIDSGLVLWFPKPHSFTGEDTCEFQVHGSTAVVNGLLEALSARNNVRIAEPGEFSRRAFYNNKLDLTEIEALADLIEAETSLQRKQALCNMRGSLREQFEIWKEKLLTIIAEIEAYIEFSESDEIEFNVERVKSKLTTLRHEMEECVEESKKLFALKEGIQVAIYGSPNVGKSSLFNCLTKSKRAIVSEVPGTTRDVLEKAYDVDGFPVVFLDTAGIRAKTDNSIENEGIVRAVSALSEPNTFVHILVASMPDFVAYKTKKPNSESWAYFKEYVGELGLAEKLINPNANSAENLFKHKTIVVMNKIDLVSEYVKDEQTIKFVSCLNGEGISDFLSCLKKHLERDFKEGLMEHPRLNSLRQKTHLLDCICGLDKFHAEIEKSAVDYTISVGYLRKSLHNLGYVTGHVVNEQILDVLFENFCVGK